MVTVCEWAKWVVGFLFDLLRLGGEWSGGSGMMKSFRGFGGLGIGSLEMMKIVKLKIWERGRELGECGEGKCGLSDVMYLILVFLM